jgi:hypothetical protein
VPGAAGNTPLSIGFREFERFGGASLGTKNILNYTLNGRLRMSG